MLIRLQSYGIVLTVDENNPGVGKIEASDLQQSACPHCEGFECCFTCDESQAGGFSKTSITESEEEVSTRLKYNGAIDGIESMILAHACAGIDVTTPDYLEGIETAVEAVGNNL